MEKFLTLAIITMTSLTIGFAMLRLPDVVITLCIATLILLALYLIVVFRNLTRPGEYK